MPLNDVGFLWTVAETGHVWQPGRDAQQGEAKPTLYLTDGRPFGAGGHRVRAYAPLKERDGLFRTFADVAPEPEAFQRFADRFGLLGVAVNRMVALEGDASDRAPVIVRGERSGEWEMAVVRMRDTVRIWELAEAQDIEALEKHIRWRDGGVDFRSHPDLAPGEYPQRPFRKSDKWIAAPEIRPDLLRLFEQSDVIRPALEHVRAVVNDQIEGRVSPRLVWNVERGRLEFRLVPESLLAAMWLQFASAVERGARFRQCAECDDWFELAVGRARHDKAYCSDACRHKAFRRRRAEEQASKQ